MIKLKSIKTKMLVVFILLISITLIIIGGISIMTASNTMQSAVEKSTKDMITQTAEQIRLQTEGVENFVIGLSANKDMVRFLETKDPDLRQDIYEFLKESQTIRSDEIETFGLLNEKGMTLITNHLLDANIDLKSRAYVQEALSGKIGVSDVLLSKSTGMLMIGIATPLYNDNEELIGCFLAAIDFSSTAKYVANVKLGEEGYAFMIDSVGNIVYHPDETKVLTENALDINIPGFTEIAQKMVNKEDGKGYYKYNGEEKYVTYVPAGKFSIAVTASVNDFMAETNKIAYIIIGLVILGLIASVIVIILFANKISNPIIQLKEAALRISNGELDVEVDINSNDELEQLADTFKDVVINLKDLVSESEIIVEHSIVGRLAERGDASKFKGGFKDIIMGANSIVDSLSSHIDNIPQLLMFVNPKFEIEYINEYGAKMAGSTQKELIGKKCGDLFNTHICNTENCTCKLSIESGTSNGGECEAIVNGNSIEIGYEAVPLKDRTGKVVGALEIVQDITASKKAQEEIEQQAKEVEKQMDISVKQADYQQIEVEKIIGNLDRLAKGNLDMVFNMAEYDEDTKEVAENIERINNSLEVSTDSMKSYIEEIADVLSRMSDKDFSTSIEREYLGHFVKLKESINNISGQFNIVLSEIMTSAYQVEAGSEQVASSSQILSQGASEQASSVEEISATITEVGAQTDENAVNAKKANEITSLAKDNAEEGNEQMKGMLDAMEDIKESSKNIANIIKVIDEIAFQTNILALNAAVEAARAGEHGRGFAVVAEEVRNLAARSAKAAKETTDMIDNSITKVEEGSKMANDTAVAFAKIVEGVTDARDIVGLIAEASSQQSSAIAQIDEGINQISGVTQSNSATSEESAAASEQMSGQAQALKGLMKEFRLK